MTAKKIKVSCMAFILLFMLVFNFKVYGADYDDHGVDIAIVETMIDKGQIVAYQDYENILPGQHISKIPAVLNKAGSCHLRMRYEFDRYSEYFEDRIFGLPDKWEFNPEDGYWYYTDIVKKDDRITIFEGFDIPADLPQKEMTSQKFKLTIYAEAYTDKPATQVTITPKPGRIHTGDVGSGGFYAVVLTASLTILVVLAFVWKGRRKDRKG